MIIFLKSVILTSLGMASVAAMIWGLVNSGSDPSGISYAVGGLLAYLAAWALSLYAVTR